MPPTAEVGVVVTDINRTVRLVIMSQRTAKINAIVGLLLQAALPVGYLIALVHVLNGLGSMQGDSTAAAAATDAMILAVFSIVRTAIGVALIGSILVWLALFKGQLREPWLRRFGRMAAIPWLVLIPVGTLFGVFVLSYFSKNREAFGAAPAGSTEPLK